ncbi:two-component regulator propeller domain-containing protein, partial [Candidatus Latescibacterota bacterium]
MKRTMILLLSLMSIFSFASFADDGKWTLYTNGNDILDIAIDDDIVWCATNGSLVRWDIHKATYKQFSNNDGLPFNDFDKVAIGRNGNLWISSHDFVWHLKGNNWNLLNYNVTIRSNIKSIYTDDYGSTWFGTAGDGLLKHDGSNYEKFLTSGVFSSTPLDIAIDKNKNVWIGADNGLWHLDNETWIHYTTDDGLAGYPVKSIAFDNSDVLWIGSNKGVTRFDGDSWKVYGKAEGIKSTYIKVIKVEADGGIWAGASGGLSYFDGSVWESFSSADGLANNMVNDIAIDPHDRIWLCHDDKDDGVTSFDGVSWTQHTTRNTAFPSNHVSSAVCDRNGTVWFATAKGLCSYDSGVWKNHRMPDGFTAMSVNKLVLGPGNEIWLLFSNSSQAGMIGFDGSDWIDYSGDNGLGESYISAIAFGRGETAWLGISGGIVHYDGTSFDRFPKNDRLISPVIYDVAQDVFGAIWCATGEGLSRFNGESWWTFTTDDGLPSNELIEVETSVDGTVWCLTKEQELVHYNGNSFERIDHEIFGNKARFVKMTVSNDNKLLVYGYYKYGDGDTTHRENKIWEYDGFLWRDFDVPQSNMNNPLPLNVMKVDDDGDIWCGTNEGLYRYDGESWSSYFVDGPLAYRISDAVVDKDNRVIFNNYPGISIFEKGTWNEYAEQISSGEMVVDLDNTVWMPSSDKTSYSGDSGFNYHEVDEQFPKVILFPMAVDLENVKWFYARETGLASFDGESWELYTTDDGLVRNEIVQVMVDGNNVKWIVYNSRYSGVTSFDGESWVSYTSYNGYISYDIYKIIKDSNNLLWFIARDVGIFSYDGLEWFFYPYNEDIVLYQIGAVESDRNNVLWFAASNGIFSFDGQNWEDYSEDKLSTNRFDFITVDHNNVKWFASSSSVVSFDDENWDDHTENLGGGGFLRKILVDKNNVKWFVYFDKIVSYDDRFEPDSPGIPSIISIYGNYPNPFNASTTIDFNLHKW